MSPATARAVRHAPAPVRAPRQRQAPTPRSVPPRERPQLRVISAPVASRQQTWVLVTCGLVLVAGLAVLLLLSISSERAAYELRQLRQQTAQLTEQQQQLQSRVQTASGPEALMKAAQRQGMVIADQATVIGPDGAVMVAAQPTQPTQAARPTTTAPAPVASVSPRPSVTAKVTATPSGSAAVKPATKASKPTMTKPTP